MSTYIKTIVLTSCVFTTLLLFPFTSYAQDARAQEEINSAVRASIESMVEQVEQNHALLSTSADTLSAYASSLEPTSSTTEALAYAEQELSYMPQRLGVPLQMLGSLPVDALFIATDTELAWEYIKGQFLLAEEHLTDIHGDLNAILILLSAPEYYSITPNPSD